MKAGETGFSVSQWDKRWCYHVNQGKAHMPIDIMKKAEQLLLPTVEETQLVKDQGGEAGWGSESRARHLHRSGPWDLLETLKPEAWSL